MLGDRLRKLRNDHNWTQEDIARKLELSRGTYAHYEINKRQPDYDTLKKLSEIFDVSIDYLITGNKYSSSKDEMWKEFLDPKTQVFFKDLMDAPEEKIEELIKFWEIIRDRDRK
ncbi:helix-turn-helix domain-containing protein [Cytobacillus firmus]|uniref:Helix-turn-helix domain-containing protein n=1 Tax=Cytobacillus firmus TaxID=1399 RepID=A0AA46PMU1_CYTFI|nr:helix-turn-helix transcriptional regulator [Cytobacillus firmus]UYG93222.1 helix-turn-helix domain-containing protein [Cytobacillus firmus]